MGCKPYIAIEELKDLDGAIVEIGSERNEGSTTYLNNFAINTGHPFYTVDVDKDRYLNALKITHGRGAYHMKGEDFLMHVWPLLNKKIAFAYLDNFDLLTQDGRDWTQRQALYKSYGLEMTNVNSKIAHCIQALLIEHYAADICYICMDDTWINKETNDFDGKGGLAIRHLQYAGFALQNKVLVGNESEGLKGGFALLKRDISKPKAEIRVSEK